MSMSGIKKIRFSYLINSSSSISITSRPSSLRKHHQWQAAAVSSPSPPVPPLKTPSINSAPLTPTSHPYPPPPIHLKPPFSFARDVTESFRRILSRLNITIPLSDLTRDLPPLLAKLRCPIKVTKSALKAPSTPTLSRPSSPFYIGSCNSSYRTEL